MSVPHRVPALRLDLHANASNMDEAAEWPDKEK